MIKVAMEIPASYLYRYAPQTDLDFALAHKVLEDEAYASFYAMRPTGRELILDNSMHELGHPLPNSELLRAARIVRADYVIAPDMLCKNDIDVKQNVKWFEDLYAVNCGEFKLATLMYGLDPLSRAQNLWKARRAEMLCLPFREPRYTWFKEFTTMSAGKLWNRIHLLGVNTLDELVQFNKLACAVPQVMWSVDTAKPVKWGIERRYMGDGLPLRGAPLSSKDLLDHPHSLEPDQLDMIDRNLELLKSICA